MKKSWCFILFSESVLNTHSVPDTEEETYFTYALTFPPNVSEAEGKIVFSSTLHKNTAYVKALSQYYEALKSKKYSNVVFLMGQDSDSAGEFMAEAMRDNLIASGVEKYDIIRTPLTEGGYRVIKKFADESRMDKYKVLLLFQELYRAELRRLGIKRNVGFTKTIALKNIAGRKGKVFNIDSDTSINLSGTSTATIVTKFITGEE